MLSAFSQTALIMCPNKSGCAHNNSPTIFPMFGLLRSFYGSFIIGRETKSDGNHKGLRSVLPCLPSHGFQTYARSLHGSLRGRMSRNKKLTLNFTVTETNGASHMHDCSPAKPVFFLSFFSFRSSISPVMPFGCGLPHIQGTFSYYAVNIQ
jgi:hypothetical protein